MPDIAALGEILIDLTQTGLDEKGCPVYTAFPGGAPANVAVAAARLGASAGFIGKVGKDGFGRSLRETLRQNEVDDSGLFETKEASTTLAVVSVDGGERSFSFYRSPGADTLLTAEEAVGALESFAVFPAVLHVGSLSLTDEPCAGATYAALDLAKARGSLISCDPNYRASLWKDEETAIEKMKSLVPYTDVIKLSEEELPLLTGTDDPEKGSLLLAEAGVPLVAVTLGENGAFYRLGDIIGSVPGIKIDLADTNGAGDSFLGALLSRLNGLTADELRRVTAAEIKEHVSFANAAAALTCTASGAIPALPTLDEVHRFLNVTGRR